MQCRCIAQFTAHTGYQLDSSHILYQERVDLSLSQLLHELVGLVDLILIDERVDRDIHTDTISVSIVTELVNVVDTVSGSHTGAEVQRTDIDGIGTMIHSSHGAGQVACGSKKFECALLFHQHYLISLML